MNIDWNSIAVQPGVHQLGVVLRRQLGIWAGLLTPTGRTIPLGAPDEERCLFCGASDTTW